MTTEDLDDMSDLPQETAPEDLPVTARGFESADKAERLAEAVAHVARFISRVINLERLDGITVAFDYDKALAEIDRGYPTTNVPTPTKSEEVVGVAMSINVVRDGVVKSHLVFHAGLMCSLLGEDEAASALAWSLIAHECGHVADMKARDEAFPNTILQPKYRGDYEQLTFPSGDILWEEYAACRASAMFARNETPRFAEGLVSVLGVAKDRAESAIRKYRLHSDISRVVAEAGNAIFEPLRLASYLLGQLDGLDQGLEQVPTVRDALSASSYAPLIDRQTHALRDLWDRRRQWRSSDEFKPLRQLYVDALAAGGIYLYLVSNGGCRVDIPFTARTMPLAADIT